MNTELRVADGSDGAVILSLLGEQLDEHDINVSLDALRAAVEAVLDNAARGMFLLAEVDGSVIGFAYLTYVWSMEHAGRCAWLEEMYVRPDWRGRGVGTALLRRAIEEARAVGCRAVDLEVDAAHSRAENLYARDGFSSLARSRWVRRLV